MTQNKKSSKLELERRIKLVLSWILADALEHEIVEQCKLDFDVQERMAWYYIKKARTKIKDIDNPDIKESIDIAVAKRRKLIRSLGKEFRNTPQGVRTILKIEDSISKLKGHFVNKVDITSKGNVIGTNHELPNLTVEQILELLSERNK